MTTFDMRDYLLGDGRVYTLIGKYPDGKVTTEACQTQVSPLDSRIGYQVKNENSEEIGANEGFIYRGSDTSMSEAQYYQLWTTTGNLGTRWCPRYWRKGEPFLREVEVRTFSKATGQLVQKYTDVTKLEIMEHHPQWKSESGLVIDDVLELAWYTKPEQKLERYFYGKHIGLVGFANLTGLGFKSYIGQFLSKDKAPVRKLFAWIQPMVIPRPAKSAPQLPAKGNAMWKPYTLISVSGQFLRTNTKTEGEFVGAVLNDGKAIPDGAKIMVINEPGLFYFDDDNQLTWYGVWYLETGEIGWMALRKGAKFADQFKPDGVVTPPPDDEEPENPNDPPPTDPKEQIIVHVAMTQLRAMMIRKIFVQEEQARLDKEAQGLMADIITMTDILEKLNVKLPDWALN